MEINTELYRLQKYARIETELKRAKEKHPDIKTIEAGRKVANFTLATTEKGYTLQNGTQVPERTEWHNAKCMKCRRIGTTALSTYTKLIRK